MPLVLDAVPGSPTANTYLTLAEYVVILESRLRVAAARPDDLRNRALVTATAAMDQAFSGAEAAARATGAKVVYGWTGTPTDEAQALAWPRVGMVNRNGVAIGDDEIPLDLKRATAELAYQLESKDLLATNTQIATGLTAIKVGSIGLNFKDGLVRSFSVLPDLVLAYLVPSWYTPAPLSAAASRDWDFEAV